MKLESVFWVPGVWLMLAVAICAVALPRIDDLGLYYDEAFLAQQARDFVEPQRAGIHPPSVSTTYIAGRPFPVRNAAYLGSLKSQLVIPSLYAFGSSVFVLRATTLAIGLLGLLFCMLIARQWFGHQTALATGLLISTDPAFFFFSQFEWGPFTSMLLCRGAGLYCLGRAFDPAATNRRWIALVCGSLMLGLGVYSRVDFAIILAGIAAALLICRRDLVAHAWQQRRTMWIVGGGAFSIAVAPVLAVVGQVLGAGAGISDRGDFDYRLNVLLSTLDGSHFFRLMTVGGLFDEVFAQLGPITAFPVLLFFSVVVLLGLGRSTANPRVPGANFVLLATLLIAAGMLAIPGAVRAHHMLNLLPLPHMIVAAAGIGLWQRAWSGSRRRTIARSCVAAAFVACLWSNATSIATTRSLIQETGGTGRFSRAVQDFVSDLDASPDAAMTEVVSLDWGFHEIALFTSNVISLHEPIWKLGAIKRRKGGYAFDGDRSTVYLYHEAPFELFGYGTAFAAALKKTEPSRYTITEHRDRRGGLAFKSVRFDAPHRMSFDGSFHIKVGSGVSPPRTPVATP